MTRPSSTPRHQGNHGQDTVAGEETESTKDARWKTASVNPKSKIRNPKSLLVLASASPRRREILKALGLRFRVMVPDADPPPGDDATPEEHALSSARAKALSVEHRVRKGWIVGVDTVVVVGRCILGKPRDREDAGRMLRLLSGRTHLVISGVAVLSKTRAALQAGRSPLSLLSASETSRVTFRTLGDQEMERYLAADEPYDKAGAYGIQGRAGAFVARVSGSYWNVVGLPVTTVLRLLFRAGYRF